MNKTEAKEKAREIIMHAMSMSMYHLENESMSESDKIEVEKAIEIQMNRVAKLMGYEKAWFS